MNSLYSKSYYYKTTSELWSLITMEHTVELERKKKIPVREKCINITRQYSLVVKCEAKEESSLTILCELGLAT